MSRISVLRFVMVFAIGLAGLGTYWVLEVLLASCTYHDRRLWEGGAVALVCNAGLVLEGLVLRRLCRKKELQS